MSNLDRLLDLARSFPDAELADVIDFLERKQRSGEPGATAEDRAWLNADLSRTDELEPYDWGPDGPPEGQPIRWDEARHAFVIEGGRDEPSR